MAVAKRSGTIVPDSTKRYAFDELPRAPLVVDAIYEGGKSGNISDEPISRLLPVGNAGGIRTATYAGNTALLVLVTSGEHSDWPDNFDPESGILTYYGDNRTPGNPIHETPRRGNATLRRLFDSAAEDRKAAFPVFAFAREGSGRSHRFLGLFVPGDWRTPSETGLSAVWRTAGARRFSNYLATFSALDVDVVPRDWLQRLLSDGEDGDGPNAWQLWRRGQQPRPLQAVRTRDARNRAEQLPAAARDRAMLEAVRAHFSSDPYRFESMAADLVRWHLGSVHVLDETRRSRDGGRDGIGLLKVGRGPASILLDFAIEAKCYSESSGVGVRQLSRLISRLRHRQFGVLITTSYLDAQAYDELVEDRHPVVVIAAADIASILNSVGVPAGDGFKNWLVERYPV
jgi:hypothetical protein